MKTPIKRMIPIAAASSLLMGFSWSNAVAQVVTNPVITCHPHTLAVQLDTHAEFKVLAKDYNPPFARQTLTYQWLKRGPGLTNFINISGATNDALMFTHVTTN